MAEVAKRTVARLKENVPAEVPGIVFLSGGQSDEEATAHLNAINASDGGPWELSFSYGRALQHAPIMAWNGDNANLAKAQDTFLKRARLNGLARSGGYSADME